MSNMPYCMFRNTLLDLQQCVDKLDELGYDLQQLSESEQVAAKMLFELCNQLNDSAEFLSL